MKKLVVMYLLICIMCALVLFIVAAENNDKTSKVVKAILMFLFEDKNVFGKILSGLIVLALSPTFVFLLVGYILKYMGLAFLFLWELGNKKESKETVA